MKTHRRDAGFSLAAIIMFATITSIFIAAAIPAYQTQMKREQEEELIFRGGEYTRAIQKYQRKFGVYPTSIDQLISTNGLRFLRRAYKDPITGKDFRLITLNPDGSLNGSTIFQQNVNNQSLFGNTSTGAQSGQQPSQSQTQNPQQPGGTGNTSPTTSPGFSSPGQTQGFGQPGSSSPGQTQGFGQSGFSSPGQTQGFGQSGFNSPGQTQGFGQSGFSSSGQPQGLAPAQTSTTQQTPGNSLGASNTLSSSDPTTGAGRGIVGVASNSDKTSLKIYNNRQKYKEWEFVAILGQQGFLGPGQVNPQGGTPASGQAPNNPFQTNTPLQTNNPSQTANPFTGQTAGQAPTSSSFGPLGGSSFGTGQQTNQDPFGTGTMTQPLPSK